MKLRPQFQLRFRDAEQFMAIKGLATASGIPINEWLLRRIENADVRGTGVDAQGGNGRSGDRTAVPVLRKTEGKPVKLHPVQPVRGELVASGGGGYNERPSSELHKDHRTYKAGEQRYCQDCGKFY